MVPARDEWGETILGNRSAPPSLGTPSARMIEQTILTEATDNDSGAVTPPILASTRPDVQRLAQPTHIGCATLRAAPS
eukprot:2924996-Pleurochrysis_carterae.AAC.1